MMKRFSVMMLSALMLLVSIGTANADRLKDLTSIAGIRSNQLVGYGVVVGLAGTGDGNSGLTLQSLQSMVSQFGLVTDSANLSAKNAAAVMVTMKTPEGTKLRRNLSSKLAQFKVLSGCCLDNIMHPKHTVSLIGQSMVNQFRMS